MYDQKQNNKNYIINNSHYPTEKENIYSNKFIREKYLVLNEVNPKNTILFKVNYKPDIIINHQTLNNIRTNISIRPIPSLSNNINNNSQQNNFFQNKYYKKDDAKNKNNKTHLFEESPIWKSDFIQGKIAKLTEAFLLDENNDIEKNMNYFNSIKDSKKEKKIFKNRINNHSRNNIDLRNNNNKVNNIIYNSQKYIKNKENNEVNNNYGNNPNNLYMVNNDKSISKYDYNYNIIKPSGYYNNKNLTTNLINNNNYNNNNNNKNSKILNIINNKKYQIKKYFFPNKKINNILRIINKNDYNNNSLNVNLNYYQIRLFKKFFKHFKQFYKICLKKYFSRFSEKINSIIKKNKYDIDNINNQSGRNNIEPKNDINKDLIDNLLIKKRNKTQIKRNIRDIIKNNRKPVSKKINNPYNSSFKASSVKTLTRDNLNSPITPITPILQFGNQKIVIRDISFKTEGNNIENKLYRDSEELIKKYKQIQTRKGKFNNFFGINQFKNDNDSLINQIRESMKLIKKNRKENSVQDNSNISSNTLNSITNKIEETRFIPRKRKLNSKINDINELKINNINNFNNINNEKNIENKEKEQNELLRNNNNMDFKNKKKNSVLNKSFDNNNNKNKINYKSKSDINYPPKNSKRNHNKHKIAKKYAFSVLIKNISSRDGRINIYINYYFLFRDKTPLISSYNILQPSNNFSINYIKNDN